VTCQERRDLLLLYVADAMDAAEREEMRAHLESGCAVCAANLVEAQAAWCAVPGALDPVPPSAHVKQRLMHRIGDRSERLPDSLVLRIFRILVPAAVAAGIAIVVTHAVLSRQLDEVQKEATAAKMLLGYQDLQIQSLKAGLSKQEQIAEILRSPDLKLIKMDATKLQPTATGCIVWDQKSQRWQLVCAGMVSAPAGKTYELWFVTKKGEKIAACTFDVDTKGDAELMVDVPHDIGPLALAAVTDEPAGGTAQPTGNFQLTGKVE
jgi:hypothetical protein